MCLLLLLQASCKHFVCSLLVFEVYNIFSCVQQVSPNNPKMKKILKKTNASQESAWPMSTSCAKERKGVLTKKKRSQVTAAVGDTNQQFVTLDVLLTDTGNDLSNVYVVTFGAGHHHGLEVVVFG